MRFSHVIFGLLALEVAAPGIDGADALTRLDTNRNHILEEAEAQAGGESSLPNSTRADTVLSNRRR
jgi:hypothetical protein